tara:strand:+ start:397 stop:561 length:165 start_codon:yes stop_codon:yes gene_type:complete
MTNKLVIKYINKDFHNDFAIVNIEGKSNPDVKTIMKQRNIQHKKILGWKTYKQK